MLLFNKNKYLKQHNSKEIILSNFSSGEVFGDTEIILKEKHFAKAVTGTDSSCFLMKKSDF